MRKIKFTNPLKKNPKRDKSHNTRMNAITSRNGLGKIFISHATRASVKTFHKVIA
jgi:hypothetical protein